MHSFELVNNELTEGSIFKLILRIVKHNTPVQQNFNKLIRIYFMADSQDQKKSEILTPQDDISPMQSSISTPRRPTRRFSPTILVTALMVIIGFGMTGGGVYYWQHKQVTTLQGQVTSLQSQLTAAQSQKTIKKHKKTTAVTPASPSTQTQTTP
jgi:uncharacterized protein HemX